MPSPGSTVKRARTRGSTASRFTEGLKQHFNEHFYKEMRAELLKKSSPPHHLPGAPGGDACADP